MRGDGAAETTSDAAMCAGALRPHVHAALLCVENLSVNTVSFFSFSAAPKRRASVE
jgi:hypothetical protein